MIIAGLKYKFQTRELLVSPTVISEHSVTEIKKESLVLLLTVPVDANWQLSHSFLSIIHPFMPINTAKWQEHEGPVSEETEWQLLKRKKCCQPIYIFKLLHLLTATMQQLMKIEWIDCWCSVSNWHLSSSSLIPCCTVNVAFCSHHLLVR